MSFENFVLTILLRLTKAVIFVSGTHLTFNRPMMSELENIQTDIEAAIRSINS